LLCPAWPSVFAASTDPSITNATRLPSPEITGTYCISSFCPFARSARLASSTLPVCMSFTHAIGTPLASGLRLGASETNAM
jgi:hypothetical protein